MGKDFCIGIDLHGTLLDKKEKIDKRFHKPLEHIIRKLKTKAKIYLCTGNDLPFVKEVVPKEIFNLLDGCVLETGCVVSKGGKEIVGTSEKIQKLSQVLKRELEGKRFPEVTEFRRRLTTVSLFCKSPKKFFEKVNGFVENSRYGKDFSVTYSSVAVDVIPKGYDKYVGMKMVSHGKIIGIADSMNDFNLLLKSDFSFVPSNCPQEVIDKLKNCGKKAVNIRGIGALEKNLVVQANFKETEGAIEILNFIYKNL